MKKLMLLLVLISSFCHAQFTIEDFDATENYTEVGGSKLRFQINNPVEFYRLKCQKVEYAQYPGGEETFKKEVLKQMNGYLSNDAYAVNGAFIFLFSINQDGSIKNFNLKPTVQNGDMLFRDLNFIVKKLQTKWKPATCNGQTIESRFRLKVDFRTENFDQ